MAALNSILVDRVFELGQCEGEVGVVFLCCNLAVKRFHNQGLLLGGANFGAVAAACAVKRADLDTIFITGKFFAKGFFGFKVFGFFAAILDQIGADNSMRANE